MAAAKQAPAQSTGAGAQAPVVDPALRFMRTQPTPVLIGSIPSGNAGGAATSFATWNPSDIPEVPAWAGAIDLNISLPVALVIPAGATATISPYAPYSAFSLQMLLAGAPEWPANTSLVVFWLDQVMSKDYGFDPMSYGPIASLGSPSSGSAVASWFDGGPNPPSFTTGSTTAVPGSTIHNAGGSPETVHLIYVFNTRVRLQRRRAKMWGMIPLGDPQNRPQIKLQLNGLVGPQPENNLVQDKAAAGITATVDTAGVAIAAMFRAKSLDILPPTVQQLPTPLVALGLNITYDNSFSIQNAGAILYKQQRTAQIYTSILHAFVNSEAPVDVDYFALWLNQARQSARWEYDQSAGTMVDYFQDLQTRYGRYLPSGIFVVDMEGGDLPTIPRETPYNALMSPDAVYAAAAGVAQTPNMSTAFRVPTGTSMSGAYAAIWTLGLVRVPY